MSCLGILIKKKKNIEKWEIKNKNKTEKLYWYTMKQNMAKKWLQQWLWPLLHAKQCVLLCVQKSSCDHHWWWKCFCFRFFFYFFFLYFYFFCFDVYVYVCNHFLFLCFTKDFFIYILALKKSEKKKNNTCT